MPMLDGSECFFYLQLQTCGKGSAQFASSGRCSAKQKSHMVNPFLVWRQLGKEVGCLVGLEVGKKLFEFEMRFKTLLAITWYGLWFSSLASSLREVCCPFRAAHEERRVAVAWCCSCALLLTLRLRVREGNIC